MTLLIKQSNKSKDLYVLLSTDLNSLMKKKRLPDDLKKKAQEYFEYCWRNKLIFSPLTFNDLS